MARARAQQSIPGTERQERPEIEEAAEDLRVIRADRMALQERETVAKKALIDKMASFGITVHRYDDADGVERRVEIVQKANAKISKVKQAPDSDAGVDSGGSDVSIQ